MSEELEEFIGNTSEEVGVDEDKVEEIVDKVLGFVLKKKIENVRSNHKEFEFGTDDYDYHD
jgi:hypothetical protein